MSQRLSASLPTSRSPTDGHIILPPVHLRDENQQHQQRAGAQGVGYERQPEPRFAVPTPTQHVRNLASSFLESTTLTSSSLADDRYPPTPRAVGVHTMLNPDSGVTSSLRPSDTQSPNTSVPPPYTIPPISGLSQSYRSQTPTGSSPSNESFGATFQGSRRILTPRSPKIASTGHGGGNRGGGEQQTPIIRGERGRIPRGEELSETGPPLPEPPPSHPQHSYFPPPAVPTQAQQSNPQSISGGMHAPSQQHASHSQSTSPSTTYSSYSQPSQTSPASIYQNNPPPSSITTSSSYFPPPSFAGSGHIGGQGGGISQMGTEGPYLPSNMSSITAPPSQSISNFQMMTFSSILGPYQVPVDASSASRLADEKRARNAGASARFRQRRKEKEREASTQIGRLEAQTRKLEEKNSQLEEEKRQLERSLGLMEEERDFYRSERDRFRKLVVGRTGERELGNGPPSPRTTRSSTTYQAAPNTTTMTLYRPPTAEGPQGEGERAPRRRRTDIHGDFAGVPPSQGPVHPAAYRPANTENSPMVSSRLPPLRLENVSAASAQTASPANTATTPRYEQYPSSAQRKWPGAFPPPPSGQHDRR